MSEDSDEIALYTEGERNLGALNRALFESKTKDKSAYSSWVRYFTHRVGVKSDIKFEAMLSYWLSWYILPTVSKIYSIFMTSLSH